MTTWKKLIQDEMEKQEETFEDMVKCTLADEELMVWFCDGLDVKKERLLLFGLSIVFISLWFMMVLNG